MDVNIFTTDNGVEGLGYVFITNPSIIIVDTTLPKYSGKEIIEFFTQNRKFQADDIHVIVLEENPTKVLDLPKNFHLINKSHKDSYKELTKILCEKLDIKTGNTKDTIFNAIAKRVIRYGNKVNLLSSKITQKQHFKNLYYLTKRLSLEILTTFLIALILLFSEKPHEDNISQRNSDLNTYRIKYYPTLIITFITLTFIVINVCLFYVSQLSLYRNQEKITKALATYVVDSTADTSDNTPGDGFCDIDDSVGDGPCTLRAAIEEANLEVDDVNINFAIKENVTTITNISDQLQGTQGATDFDQLTHFAKIDINGTKHLLFQEFSGDAGLRDIFYYRSDIPVGIDNPVNVSTALPSGYGSGIDYINDLVVDSTGLATLLFTSQGIRGYLDVYLAKYDQNGLVGSLLNLSDQLQAGEGTDFGYGLSVKLDDSGDPIVVFHECCGGQGQDDIYLYDSNNPISPTNPHNLSVSLAGSQGGGVGATAYLEIKNNIAYVAWSEATGLRGASDMYFYDNSLAVSATNPRNLSNSISNGAWGTTDVADSSIKFLVSDSGVGYVIWGEDGPQNFNADIFIYRSDQAVSATNPLNISNKLTSTMKDEYTSGGEIDIDSSGNPYVVWSEAGTGPPSSYRSYLYRGDTDTVINLSGKVDPLDTRSGNSSQDPKIVILNDDSIHVLFIDSNGVDAAVVRNRRHVSNGVDADADLFYYQPNIADSGSNPLNLSDLLPGTEGTGTSDYAQLVERPGGTVFSSWTESMGARGSYDLYHYDNSVGQTSNNPRNISNLLPSGEGLLDTFPIGVRNGYYPNNSKINFDSDGFLRQSWIEANGARGYMDLYMLEENLELTNNVQTITPNSALPTITKDNISINGESQNGSSCTTKTLNIEIDGTSAGSTNGLTVSSGASSAVSIRGLVLNHFGTSEITVTDSNQVNITCNIIGLDADGTTMEIGGSGGDGIVVSGSSHLVIGGSTVSDRNIISGTGDDGIIISGSSTANIQGNFIGTDKTGLLDKGNDDVGITISSTGRGTIIGGTTSINPNVECIGSCNLISGNSSGIYLSQGFGDPYADRNISILGNYIGIDRTGSSAIGNNTGIEITYADGITIGGANTGERNIISGNTQNGIYVYSTNTNRVQELIVQNNFIGTNNAGTSALGNNINGILAFNHMPDLTVTGNTISSNGENGLETDLLLAIAPVDSINIFNNKIGTGSNGSGDLGNSYSGIYLAGRGQVNIGAQDQGNIINNSGHRGITVNSAPDPDPPSATISADILYNTFSGNDQGGILAYWNGHLISNNVIDANTGDGIAYLAGTNLRIIANQVSNNSGKGVSLPSNFIPRGARIGRNSFYNNSFNIDLANDGRTVNDLDDVDTGTNNLQNYPELVSAEILGTTLSIFGTFNSIPSEYYLVEFFSTDLGVAAAGDTKSYLGSDVINTDANGDFDFSISPLTLTSITLDPGETYLSATASRCVDANCTLTEDAIETSEISNSIEITEILPSETPAPTVTETPAPTLTDTPIPSDTPIPAPTNTPIPGVTATQTPIPTATNTPLPTQTNTPIPTSTITPIPSATNTPIPTTTNTPVPTMTSTPSDYSAPVATTIVIQPTEAESVINPTPTEVASEVGVTVTPTITLSPTSQISEEIKDNLSLDFSPKEGYAIPNDSILKSPIVKSTTKSITERLDSIVENSNIIGDVIKTSIDLGETIKPITDNLNYLLSLQFIGAQTAEIGVSTINILALTTPAIVTVLSQPKVLFYALAWFWKRRSKQPWGIVFDKATGAPVAFATLVLSQNGKTISTQATDLQGKYGFTADKGTYQLYISHSDYLDFVSDIVVHYDGEIISQDFEVTSKSRDDVNSNLRWTLYKFKKQIASNLFILNTLFFSIGFVYTLFAIINHLTVVNYVILSLYLLQFILMFVFYFFKDKEFGQVTDVSTGLPIPGAIVRVFNDERQIDVTITDNQGRYSFILEPGNYFLRATANGYIFPSDDSPNITHDKLGGKLLKFTTQDKQRVSIKIYMRKFSTLSVNKEAILSPFS